MTTPTQKINKKQALLIELEEAKKGCKHKVATTKNKIIRCGDDFGICYECEERISKLTQALKILEGGK